MEPPERRTCNKTFLARWFLWAQKAPKVPKNFAARPTAVVFYGPENRCFGHVQLPRRRSRGQIAVSLGVAPAVPGLQTLNPDL